ncbi:MAG: FAD-dependent oxidoreductase [Acidobacteriota bacterium]
MTKPTAWKCEVCGYIHFGDAPPDQCPVCGVGPEMFSPFEAAAPSPPPALGASWRCTVCGHVHVGELPPETCPVCGAARSMFESYQAAQAATADAGIERIVVLGAGIAGVTAAEQARAVCPGVSIALVAGEAGLPYYRINLTRYLAYEVSEAALVLKPETWFAEQRIDLVHGEATVIDRERREVRLRDERSFKYDRLVIATGSHAFVPAIPGAVQEGVFTLRKKDDVHTLWEKVKPGSRCVCVGGGLLGLETAGALARRGIKVTVLEGFPWLLPRQLAEPAGRMLQAHVEATGIEVRCGVKVEEILRDESGLQVRLASGESIAGQAVIVAAGVRPNSHLARQARIETRGGILVDDRMFTSDPAVLAAGDVAEHRGVVYGIWPASYAQGLVAGANAAGGNLEFPGLAPSTRLKVLNVDLYSIGQHQPTDGSYHVFERQEAGHYYRFVCRDGQLVGANLYGDTGLAGLVKETIERSTQIAESQELLARVPGLGDYCGRTH